jgi:hypothetical protein
MLQEARMATFSLFGILKTVVGFLVLKVLVKYLENYKKKS